VCPHCGYKDRDSWEIDFGLGMDGDAEVQCHFCGEDFIASRIVTVKYCTKKKEGQPNV
jgi:hypothetical protein